MATSPTFGAAGLGAVLLGALLVLLVLIYACGVQEPRNVPGDTPSVAIPAAEQTSWS